MSIILTSEKFLTDNELNQLFKLLSRYRGQRDRILILLTLFSGGRSAEVLNIKKSDVTESSVTLYGLKGSHDRTIQLPEDFASELRGFISSLGNDDKLFQITTRHFRRIWNQYRPCKKGIHSLRHSFCVKLYMASRNIRLVQSAAGHKSLANTEIYLNFVQSKEEMKKAIGSMW